MKPFPHSVWEDVTSREVFSDHTRRMRVPGGWLYQVKVGSFTGSYSNVFKLESITTTFVPDPHADESK